MLILLKIIELNLKTKCYQSIIFEMNFVYLMVVEQ